MEQQLKRGKNAVVHHDGFEWLSRAGFVARGIVYVLVGILAIKLAGGSNGTNASQQGAMRTIAAQPLGNVMLIVVAIGLGGYAFWRLTRAIVGHGPEDSDSGMERVAAAASGIAYAILCALAVEILLGSGGGSGSAKKPTAGVLGWPGGTWLVGIAGVALVCVGLYQGYRAITTDFLEDSKTEKMGPGTRKWIAWIGRIGHLARMLVFCLIGIFLVDAAVNANARKAVGLDGALAKVDHASYGPLLLGLVAAGLIAFGVYSLSDARFRRI